MISIQDITLQRGAQRLLDNTSLTIFPGRKVGIIGQNGCGKSTLFALLLGQLQLDGGQLSIPKNWRIAHMAQEVASSEQSAVEYVLDGDTALRSAQKAISDAEQLHDDQALVDAYSLLDAVDGYNAQYRAEKLLHGLGFTQDEVTQNVQSFSGGWRIRLNLAQALMSPSDLLLLDEPTNHLDVDAIVWLEEWLNAYTGTLIFISHDRDFLDNVCDEIVHIENQKLNSYKGNYADFEDQRAQQLSQQQALFVKQQRRIEEIEKFVTRFKAKASKAKQAQSRVKELERMEKISAAHVDSPFHFTFFESDKYSTPLINLSKVTMGYGEKIILKNVNMSLMPGSRIGLLGPNGAGKSTMIKTMVGDIAALNGERVCGEHLKVGYFAQHQLEALDIHASALTHLQRLSPRATEQQIRSFLGGFNFHGDKALAPIEPFSGGEKARLALALVAWQKPNLLLLDEPTNHLDLEMRQALCEALQEYAGALVVISHDRYLLRNTVDEYWRVYGGEVTEFDGTLDDYHEWLVKAEREAAQAKLKAASAAKKAASAPIKNNQQQNLRKLEEQLEKIQTKLRENEAELADASSYEASNQEKLTALLQEQSELKNNLSATEAQWLELLDQIEHSN